LTLGEVHYAAFWNVLIGIPYKYPQSNENYKHWWQQWDIVYQRMTGNDTETPPAVEGPERLHNQ